MRLRPWISYTARTLLLLAGGAGCSLIAGYSSGDPMYSQYECATVLKNCVPKSPASVGVTVHAPAQSGDCYKVLTDLAVGDPHHCTQTGAAPGTVRNSVYSDLGHSGLHGATHIVTRTQDAGVATEDFLHVTWTGDVADVYVAYDSRVPPPPWLTTDYVRVDDAQGQPEVVAVTEPNPSRRREFHLYRRSSIPPGSKTLKVPGNMYQQPPALAPVMYMVYFEPAPGFDCDDPAAKVIGAFDGNSCGDGRSEAEVEADHAAECVRQKGASMCATTTCTARGTCPARDAVSNQSPPLTIGPWSFLRHSEIEFDPAAHPARATVRIDGDQYNRDVTGKLDFEYEIDSFGRLWLMRLNSMFLDIAPIDHRSTTFDDIVIGLLAPVPASCSVGQNPPWATPCDTYRVAAGDLAAKMSFAFRDSESVFVARNVFPFDIRIDHGQRTFRFQGGPLVTNTVVGGEEVRISTTLDLQGRFLNFAPQAVASESTRSVECGLGEDRASSNLAPVHLDGSASFKVYNDPIPPSAHEWYEDWGLPTQRSWGTGPRVTIPKHQLGFGVHTMSLLIFDGLGGVDRDDFEVEVRDSIPPSLQVPPDVFFLPERPGPVTLDLGEAAASDICSPDVEITNDAPAGSVFQPGTTSVTWSADDGRGHLAQGVQRVHVFRAPPDEGLPAVAGWAAQVVANLGKSSSSGKKSLEECQPARPCVFRVAGLAAALDATLERLAPHAGGAAGDEVAGILESLERVREAWRGVDSLLEEAATMGAGAEALWAGAAETLDSAATLLAEAAGRLETVAGEPSE